MGRTKKKINNIDDLNQISKNSNSNNLSKFENQSQEENQIEQEKKNKLDEQEINYDSDIITINDFKKKEMMLYEVLNNFFNQCKIDEIKMIIEMIDGNHIISLRFLDWFVTRYCYLYKLSIPIDNTYNKEQVANINISYKAQLKSFKKKYFDPFRRKKKFFYCFGKHELNILTTLGQLNFFRWALSFDIIKYTESNLKNISSKISHVNSYFKKNIIDSNSLTITTSEEQSDNFEKKKCSDTKSCFSSENLSSENNFEIDIINNDKKIFSDKKLSQDDIDFLMENNQSSNLIQNNLEIFKKRNKPSKIFNSLKNSQPSYKYPQISRNICIEF